MAFEWLGRMVGMDGDDPRGPEVYGYDGTGGQYANPVMGRGQPGSGQQVDRENFNLDYNNGGTQLGNAGSNIAERNREAAGNLSSGAAAQGAYTGQQAATLGGRGNQLAGYAASSQNPLQQANYGAANNAIDAAGQNANQQALLARMMQGQAARDTGSAAQAQLQQGTNEAINSAMSIAKSGQGFGGGAAASAQAAQAAPGAIANQANQSAALRAQEDQANAARQLQALGMSGQQLAGIGQQQLQAGGMLGQMAGANAALGQQGIEANNQREVALGQLGLGYNQAGMQGALSSAELAQSGMQNAAQLGLQGDIAGGNLLAQGQQMDLDAAALAQQGGISYEQALNQLYGTDMNYHLGSRELVAGEEQQQAGGVIGAIGSLFGL